VRLDERGKMPRSLSTYWGKRVGVNAGELRLQLFSLAPASGERVGVRGLSERIFPHANPLPEGEGTAPCVFPR